jgi:hypothetical protein
MDQREDKTIELKYSLTFLQRYFNPPGVLIYHFLQMLGLPALCYLLLVDFWGDGIPTFFTWVIILFLYRRFLGDAMFLLKRDASECIVVVIRPRDIGFGRKKVEYWLPWKRRSKVYRGLFGANLINYGWGRYTIVVPENAISFSELRRLVEENANDADKA